MDHRLLKIQIQAATHQVHLVRRFYHSLKETARRLRQSSPAKPAAWCTRIEYQMGDIYTDHLISAGITAQQRRHLQLVAALCNGRFYAECENPKRAPKIKQEQLVEALRQVVFRMVSTNFPPTLGRYDSVKSWASRIVASWLKDGQRLNPKTGLLEPADPDHF